MTEIWSTTVISIIYSKHLTHAKRMKFLDAAQAKMNSIIPDRNILVALTEEILSAAERLYNIEGNIGLI